MIKTTPSCTIENEKIVWTENSKNIWSFTILDIENFKKVYEMKKDFNTLEKINNLWNESLKQREIEKTYESYNIDINQDAENTEYLEIVAGFSAFGVIKHTFPDHLRLMMPLALNIGDISDIYERKRSFLLNNGEDYEIEKHFKELDELLKKVKIVRIWSSKICCDEFLMFCFLCDYIKNKEIKVTFADEFLESTWSIGCMAKEEVEALSLKEHNLTPEEIQKYQNIWKKVFLENSEIRYMKKKEVCSVSFDHFTDYILEIVSKCQEISVSALTAKLMGDRLIENFGTLEYYYMIKRLIDLGRLEIVKDGKDFDIVKYFHSDSFGHSIIKVKDA